MEKKEIMFTIDVPYTPVEEVPVVLAQTATQNPRPQPDYILKSCIETEHEDKPSAISSVDPAAAVLLYVQRLRKKPLDISGFKPTLLVEPQHGRLNEIVVHDESLVPHHDDYRSYIYYPDPGYIGEDSATFMVEFEGKYYKVEIEIQVRVIIDDHDNYGCDSRPKGIKVRKPSRGDTGDTSLDLSSIVSFADLSGSALGSTTGDKITLDDNAAGHGWFIDYTPYLNEEWLPTSNPYEWQAKPGGCE
jgi:hypothetical protein